MLSLLLSCTPIQSRSCPQGADCTPQVADSAQDSLLVDTQDAWTWDEEDVAMLIGKARSYRSIQGAITEAADGDVVLVRAGTHRERIDFHGKALHVG